jgi:NADH dehydrogenase
VTSGAPLDLVTGAFGNTGSAIARLVSDQGRQVRTLTDHPHESSSIDVRPYQFDDSDALAASFDGVRTFYNTFWMRTGDGRGGYDTAVARSKALLTAAERAGVERIVQFSVAHPSLDSPYPYFRGKAQVEAFAGRLTVPVTFVRPALIFGGSAAMLHDLARMLRRLPVFGYAGDGRYRVRPVHVDDVAALCVAAGSGEVHELVIDAVGPERPTFLELVTMVRAAVGSRARLVRMPVWAVLAGASVLGRISGQALLTADELRSTIDGLADSDAPSTGSTSLSAWIEAHGDELGVRAASGG